MDALIGTLVEVPVEDLQMVRAALNSAYHHSTVLDLQEQYRKLQQRPQQSKLTQALGNALTLIGAHLEVAAADPNESTNDPERD